MGKLSFVALALLAMAPSAFAADSVTVQRPAVYNEDADVPGSVRKECKLDEQLPDFIAQYAKETGTTINFAPAVQTGQQGRVLDMEFTNVTADGNAFMGHHKSVTVKGKLYENGKVIGSFKGKRNSMGGAFGNYKGTCSVLGRTVDALGKDIAGWLAAPKMDAMLGDLE
ncbi:hypothetical protein FHW69_002149 [Luteibacter sp. Sphag1AF]|uniref:hypothetical protein n=1 Tax=Luteibacter sp. Sphag1AF TaxID=2587031 RepID=UPI00161A8400|nr:hypothetical protein [Luteibacter sp. Sphag1AF]MBB3227526.1 hypothetical protein [Luteibacter sp. Sphag1AF]